MQHRAAAVAAGYPLMLYSYSSRAVSDLRGFYAATKAGNPRPLLSLYDVYHHLGYDAIRTIQRPPAASSIAATTR